MIDRNAYTSLNEAAANVAVGKSSMRPAMGMNAPNMSNSNSPPQGVQWGDPSIGGAKNATELAAYLSGQGNVGVEDAAKAAAASPSSTASALSMKPGSSVSRGSSPVRTATKPALKRTAPQATVADDVEYTAQEILDILAEAYGFNGAALSRSLANGTHADYLSQFTPSAGGAGKISSRGNAMSRSSGTAAKAPKAPAPTAKGGASVNEKSNGWGGRNIGGARNASELAAWLAKNNQNGVQGQVDARMDWPTGEVGPQTMGQRYWFRGQDRDGDSNRSLASYGRVTLAPSARKNISQWQFTHPKPPMPDNYIPPPSPNNSGNLRSRPPVPPTRYGPTSRGTASSVADDVEYTAQEILDILAEATGQDFNEMCQSAKSDPKRPVRREVSLRKELQIKKRGNNFVPTKGMKTNPKLADSVELDIDSLIAEGVAQYGEEVFLEIISDFDETGEMSQELFDLLD